MTGLLTSHLSVVEAIEGLWWVAQTRPQYEERLTKDLTAAGTFAYLPRTLIYRRRVDAKGHTHRTKVMVPAFPCYVFFCGDEDDRYRAACSIATVRMLPVRNQNKFRRQLSAVEIAIGIDPQLSAVAALKVGHRVEVIDGPLMGKFGTVDRIGGTTVYFEIDILGRATPAEVPAEFVRPLN